VCVPADIAIVYWVIILTIIIALLTIIASSMRENLVGGLVVSGILIIIAGAVFPDVISSIYSVGC